MINEGYESYESSRSSFSSIGLTSAYGNADNKDIATQTDSSPVTIRSWQIQRTCQRKFTSIPPSKHSQKHVSLLPDGTEVYIIESLNVGFNASTQTLNSDIYSRNKSEIREILTSWRVLTILFPSLLYLVLYTLDQILDIVVCSRFCKDGDSWWCGFGFFFIIGPSLLISVFAYEQLTQPDIPSVKPVKKQIGRLLCVFQLTPYYIIGRRVWWALKAWSWAEHREEKYRSMSNDLWEKASQENDSSTVKLLQSILESVPQLSLQSYILLEKLSEKQLFGEGGPTSVLWMSVFVNLISASSGIASSHSQSMFERCAGSLAVITTLGSRVIICGEIGSLHPALWIVPVFGSFLIGFVTRVSESTEKTFAGHIQKLEKYSLEAFMMASASPPFNVTGMFCSFVYVLAAIVFLVENPAQFINIFALILSTVGQTIWVTIGFCLINTPSQDRRNRIEESNPA